MFVTVPLFFPSDFPAAALQQSPHSANLRVRLFLISKINGFYANPSQYIPIEKTKTPDGSPIGDFSCDY